jgi:hypothetical protein
MNIATFLLSMAVALMLAVGAGSSGQQHAPQLGGSVLGPRSLTAFQVESLANR